MNTKQGALLPMLAVVAATGFPVLSQAQAGADSGAGPASDYLPIVKVAPRYPPEAALLELGGYVLLEYTVTKTGLTKDIQVMDASSPIFEHGAVQSAAKYKSKPRIVDGAAVDTSGVRALVVFGDREAARDVASDAETVFVSLVK